MFASLRLRQANLATIVEWIEIHFDIYIIIVTNCSHKKLRFNVVTVEGSGWCP